jgi:hypothetical protein
MEILKILLPSILFLLFSIAFVVLAVVIFVPIVKSQKASGGIVNTDSLRMDHLFRVPCKKEELVHRLYRPNVKEVMEYTFDESAMTITFTQQNASLSYAVFVREYEGSCYVRLHKQRMLHSRCIIPYFVNEFMIKKFHAEPLPYEQYKDKCA